jgi:predicted transcriptional regulator
MDIQAEKLNLIKWITEVEEPSVIEQFIALKNEQQRDWWNEMSDEEKAEIEEGLSEASRDEVYSHEEVMAKYKKYGSSSIKD